MRKGYAWLYPLAALLALAALGVRLYQWGVQGQRLDYWQLLVPGVAFILLAIAWQRSQRSRGGVDG
jgi:hypothetical protein